MSETHTHTGTHSHGIHAQTLAHTQTHTLLEKVNKHARVAYF